MGTRFFTFSKPNDSVINENVNVPRRSMTGLLFLFTAPSVAGTRDSEKFVNPDITSVKIDIDGVPNMLYSRGMISTDLYKSILTGVSQETLQSKKKTSTQTINLLFGLIYEPTQITIFMDQASP